MQLPNVFNNEKKFIFSNWSNEDFEGVWDGARTTIKAGEIKELPMYLAYNFCKHFVDREMDKVGQGAFAGNDDARKPLEDKTIAEITGDTESPALSALKEKIKEEVKEAEEKKVVKADKAPNKTKTKEFAGLEE